MGRTKHSHQERGFALLLTIFGLLLLTGIAAAMMFSSDTETTIAVNYRDKESATYAALSGLQEARDRLHPLYGDISGYSALGRALPLGPGPTQLAGLNNGQVLYIINPDSSRGETATSIAPWNYNSGNNPYFDKELCQQQYTAAGLGLTTNPPGTPCTAVPSSSCTKAVGSNTGSGWCAYYDNSNNATEWQLTDSSGNPIPLDYKWVRITLKADNSGLVYVQTPASAANGTQVCWDARYDQQIQKPAAAGTNCLGSDTYSIAPRIPVNTPGVGYSHSSPPTVTFVGGFGSGATATAQLADTAGAVDAASITASGAGYTSVPVVSITNPGSGTGAVLQAVVTGSPVTAVAMGSSNYCYSTGTIGLSVAFAPNPPPTAGGSASATVAMTGQACISAATASATCGSSMKGDTVTLSDGGGFSGTITLDNKGKYTGGVSVTAVGNYSSVPGGGGNVVVNGTGSKGSCSVTVQYVGGIQVASLSLASGGEYVSQPTASISGPTPQAPSSTQPTVTVSWTAGSNNGQIGSIRITNGGSGYASSGPCYYTLSFTGGGGSGANGCASSSGVTTYVSGITLTSPGSGYVTAPQVVISGPGSGATATAYLTGGQRLMLGQVYTLTSLALTRNGSRSMSQQEVAVTPPWSFQLGGALTLAGPTPSFGTPNSNVYHVNGNDAAGTGTEPATCNNTPGVALPAIGVYDSAAQQCVISGQYTDSNGVQQQCSGVPNPLGKPANYTGAQSSPDIQVEAAANPNPTELRQLASDIYSQSGTVQLGPPLQGTGMCTPSAGPPVVDCGDFTGSSVSNWGSATNLQTVVVNGNLTLSGNPQGFGVLVITGNLVLQGDFTWHGLVLVMGTATVDNSGGGNGSITGALYVANDSNNTLGSSYFNWNGGGGNGIQYDHCWADDLINRFPPATSSQPLQVLSTRTLQF
jgi:hypothetical protein